jgi:hypothetical protein
MADSSFFIVQESTLYVIESQRRSTIQLKQSTLRQQSRISFYIDDSSDSVL